MPHKPSYNIIFDLNDVIFLYNPTQLGTPQQFSIIKDMVSVVHQVHAQTNHFGKKQHQLYVLSNSSMSVYQNLMTHHAPMFTYFDGISTTAQSGFKKPDSRAFLYLLQKYNLEPHTCIFIDDKQENVATAQALGMRGIVCNNPEQVLQELKKHYVL